MRRPTRIVRRIMAALQLEPKDWPSGDPAVSAAAKVIEKWRLRTQQRMERELEAWRETCWNCSGRPCWSVGFDGHHYCDTCLSMIAD